MAETAGGNIMEDVFKWAGHALALPAVIGTLVGWFPFIAAFTAFVWYCVQIWESATAKDLRRQLHEWRLRRMQRSIAKIQERIKRFSPPEKKDDM